MTGWISEFRRAARALSKAPGFTIACALTVAIGMGAITAVYGLVDGVLLRPLPYPASDRIVAIGHAARGLDLAEGGISDGAYLHYRANNASFEDIATYYDNVVNLTGDGDAERVPVAMVSASFFSVLGARTAAGRLPRADDVDGSGDVVVLISYDLWQRRYGGDPAVVGTSIEINRGPRQVIGVLERGFDFPRPDIDIWYPSDPDPATARATDLYQSGIARLKPGLSPAQAERDLDRLITTLPDAYPDLTRRLLEDSQLRSLVRPLKEQVVGEARGALWLLLGGMAFLLLIGCANVANLFLVRGAHRHRDIAVRTALGARRADLVRFFVAESVLVVLLGGALGLLLADTGMQALIAYGPSLPRLHEVGLDGRVLAFAAMLSLLLALLFASAPLFRPAHDSPGSALRESGSGATATASRRRTLKALVIAQVALALVLLVGSALMAQSFLRLRRADPGFRADGVLTAEIALPRRGYESYDATRRLWETVIERVRALPGVQSAASVTGLPLVPRPAYYDFALDLESRPGESRAAITMYHVSPDYFETMGIPIVDGTAAADLIGAAERPVLLSEAAARRLFAGENAIGQRIRRSVGNDVPWATVVGIAGDVPRQHVGGAPAEIVYLPTLGSAVDPGLSPGHGTLVLRATVPPATLASAVRDIVREIDANLPVANVRTMERVVTLSMARTRFTMMLLGIAAIAALFLGAVGLYGVISYDVSRRFREFGIRIALGAGAGSVRTMVLRESASLALAGIGLGVVGALGLTRLLRGLVFQVDPMDPVTIVATAGLLLGVALLACWVPAWRTARLDPMRALRIE